MRNLFAFIWKHYFFFLFFILEIFAFSLIVQNNYYHQARFFHSTNQITGSILNIYNNVAEYFSLIKTNKILAEENATLLSMKKNSFIKIGSKMVLIDDTLHKQKYQYISAKVINNSIHKRNNYLTLDKGTNHGIKRDMAVISSRGIVGIIKDVSRNFSSVISVLHKKTTISAKIKKNSAVGNIIWEGINYKIGTMTDVPAHFKISTGDTIITSGYSSIFPEGIPVGTVMDYEIDKGSYFYTIYFLFSEDYNNISYVYVVNNLMKDEQQGIEKPLQQDE